MLTMLQWMTLIVFFVTIAAVVVNKLDAPSRRCSASSS